MVLLFFLSLLFALQVTAAPAAGILVDQKAHTLVAPEGKSYVWYFQGGQLVGEQNRQLAITSSGTYAVKVVNADGAETWQQVTVAVQPDGTIKKIFLIGDSTVQFYESGWYPQTGWGQVLPHFFDESQVTIVNKAVGGTSSKSFYDNFWAAVLSEVSEGDYVFIQFGHNDYNPNDPARNTDAATTYKQYLLNYINQTKNKKAFPVLVTPMHRNSWNGDQIVNGWKGYPQAMREMAAQTNTPLIDLHNRSEALFESLGRAYVEKHIFLHLKAGEYPRYPLDVSDLTDNVHFQEMGATELAKLVVEGIKDLPARAEMAALMPHLKPLHELTVTADITQDATLTRTGSYPAGLRLTLKANRPAGFHFAGWTDSNGKLAGIKMNHSFTMPDHAVRFQANFSPVEAAPLVAGATYRIEAQHSQLFLDINNLWRNANSPTANGTEIVQYPYTGNLSQHWVLNDAGNGYFFITSAASNKSMDVQAKSTADGATILQYTTGTATSTNQHFRLEQNTDGSYNIIARHSNKCLQIPDASTASGALLKQVTCGAENSQKFILHRLVVASSPEEEALANELLLYPNPSRSGFRLQASFRFSYLVYDALGNIQEEGTGYQEKEIGAALKPGMYFLKVQLGTKARFIKLIKE